MNNMNIDTSSKVSTTTRTTSSSTQTRNSSSTGFADELSSMSSQKSEETKDSKKTSETDKKAADKAGRHPCDRGAGAGKAQWGFSHLPLSQSGNSGGHATGTEPV